MFGRRIQIELEKKDDIIHLEPGGDKHIGHKGFDEDLYRRYIQRIIDDPNRYTLFMGDQLDAITPYDKRFNPDMADEHDIDNQMVKWEELTQPLLQLHMEYYKILGMLHGNHEYNIRGLSRAYIENRMCKPYGVEFLGSRAFLGLEVLHKKKVLGRWNILAIHGQGGSRPETMFDHMKVNHYADIFLCGHSHQKRYQCESVIDFDYDEAKPYEREIHLVNTGTFCKTLIEDVDGYMDRKNKVVLSAMGTVTLSIDAYNGKITGHM